MRTSRFFHGAILASIVLLEAGCSMMPASGPAAQDIRSEAAAEPDSLPYAAVRLNPSAVDIIGSYNPRIAGAFPDTRPPATIRFGVGDVVAVTIFEAAAGGLFIPSEAGVRPGNFITLPNQAVDSAGNISVPYAGAIRAQNRTASEVQQAIVDALKNRAIEPQAVVSTSEQRTSLISVLGEVNNPSRFPASAGGEHLLDAITRAGGPKGQGFDTWLMLERKGRRAVVPFGALVYEPRNNIFVHPDDTLYVYREPQTFVAFGASGQQGVFNFESWRLTLAEAVGRAGGLNDTLADPAAVFLYRGETVEVAKRLGIDCSRFSGPIIPVVYNLNLKDPAGYFLATKFQIRNKDVIYVSNNETVQAAKAMNYFRLVVATVNDPIVAASNGIALRNQIKFLP